MKGMLKYLSPFAPDQSGAVSALYGMGGIIVICDAGGCTGNICGFDEPRWFEEKNGKKSAIFSAGLRDMDAILGRDERLVEKLADAAELLDASFAALIGTPVPAVIATDFGALARMAEDRTGLPVLTVECTGTRLYDVGESDAYIAMFHIFVEDNPDNFRGNAGKVDGSGILGVIGCSPLDISRTEVDAAGLYAKENGFSGAACYGMGAGLDEVRRAGTASKNLVVSPAGIAAAEYLKNTFGTPYEVGYPFFDEEFKERLRGLRGKRVLIVHQQAAANEIRKMIAPAGSGKDLFPETGEEAERSSRGSSETDLVCGTWFMQIPELAQPQDVRFEREEEFISFAENGDFDVIIGDPKFRRTLRGWSGEYIDCPHFAVSGILSRQQPDYKGKIL